MSSVRRSRQFSSVTRIIRQDTPRAGPVVDSRSRSRTKYCTLLNYVANKKNDKEPPYNIIRLVATEIEMAFAPKNLPILALKR